MVPNAFVMTKNTLKYVATHGNPAPFSEQNNLCMGASNGTQPTGASVIPQHPFGTFLLKTLAENLPGYNGLSEEQINVSSEHTHEGVKVRIGLVPPRKQQKEEVPPPISQFVQWFLGHAQTERPENQDRLEQSMQFVQEMAAQIGAEVTLHKTEGKLVLRLPVLPLHSETVQVQDTSAIRHLADKALEQHMHDLDFGVDALAQALFMSKSTLQRRMHEAHQVSVTMYIRKARLERAKQMLEHTNTTLSSICASCGFRHTTLLNRIFLEYYKVKPAEYRILCNKI